MDKIRISVRGLIEFVMRSGDIDNRFRTMNSLKEGQRIHKRLQKEYGLHFISEVRLIREEVVEGVLFQVEGRADGVYHKGTDVLIDEIKSTTRNLEELTEKSNPLHWAQAMCYGYFYGRDHSLEKIKIRLTYYQIDTEEVKRLEREFEIKTLEEFYSGLLRSYLNFSKKIIAFRKIRNEGIERLQFPFIQYRKGQRKLAVGCFQAIKEGKDLLVEAPTGIGKTMSTLFPAVKTMGEDYIDKIFYLTARSTTKEAANKALYHLTDRGLRIKSITLTAKEKICLNNEVKCNPEDCPFAKGHFDRVNDAILEIYEEEDLLHVETILDYAKKHKVCPMEFQLDLSIYSDVVICDYNYVFDPQIYLRRFFENNLDRYVFLVDEAHNLVDRGRNMYSAAIEKEKIEEILRTDGEDKTLLTILKSLHFLEEHIEEEISKGPKEVYISASYKEELMKTVQICLKNMEKFLAKERDHELYEKIMDLYFDLNHFVKISDFYDTDFKTVAHIEEDKGFYEIKCLDTSRIFKSILTRAVSSIFFSATLTPTAFYGELFGAEDYYTLRLPSPFPEENFKLGVLPLSTRYVDREKNYGEITLALEKFTEDEGNFMLFFPSYHFMKEIYYRFRKDPRKVIQESSMSERQRDEFLKEFTTESSIIAFAVLGGVFSEGIDLIGERLNAAAIVSVGLPGVGLDTKLIRDYFQEKEGKGFEYAFLYPGMNKVFQAAGRVIRTPEDKGSVLLIDDRFLTAQYRKLFPLHWNTIKRINNIHEIEKLDIERT